MLFVKWIFQFAAVIAISAFLYEVYRLREEFNRLAQRCNSKTFWFDTEVKSPQISDSTKGSQLDVYLSKLFSEGSSVWCWGTNHTNRLCHFRHLCYITSEKSFVFFHGVNSTMVGVPSNRFDPALLDLSSVENHNTQYFNFVDVPLSSALEILADIKVIDGVSLIFSRLHPDNIMHVIHDDLLPLYTTLMMIQGLPSSQDPFSVHLMFADKHSKGEYFDLYKLFSSFEPILRSDESKDAQAICFHEAYVGLSKHSVWYQYGFYQPQGAVPEATVTSQDIHQFTKYLSHRLMASSDNQDGLIVLVSRKETRLILNEVELCLALTNQLQRKVISVSMETHSIREIVEIFSHAILVLGMHGSLLVFSMFLPPGGIVLELFPYGINPDHYTPYKTLANIPRLGLVYRSWRNRDKKNSIQYPDRPKELGGIRHLAEEEQHQISVIEEVEQHLCCDNPAWLFYIYQDTVVNVDEILLLVNSALKEQRQIVQNLSQERNRLTDMNSEYIIYPAEVRPQCQTLCLNHALNKCDLSLYCQWSSPWNVKYATQVNYEIWVQESGKEEHTFFSVSGTELSISENIEEHAYYFIWIRPVVEGVHGPIKFTACNTTIIQDNIK